MYRFFILLGLLVVTSVGLGVSGPSWPEAPPAESDVLVEVEPLFWGLPAVRIMSQEPAWLSLGTGIGVLMVGMGGVGVVSITLYGAGLLFATGQLAVGLVAMGQVGFGIILWLGQLGGAFIAAGQLAGGRLAWGQGHFGGDGEEFFKLLNEDLSDLFRFK